MVTTHETISTFTLRISAWLCDFTWSSVATSVSTVSSYASTSRGHTPPPPHSFSPEAVPGLPPVALPYVPPISYQTSRCGVSTRTSLHGRPSTTITPPMDSFVNTVLNLPFPLPTPCYTHPSERVEDLEKMADEVAKRSRDLSGDLPKAAGAATLEGLDGEVNRDYLNNKTLPGSPLPSGKFGDNHDQEESQQGRRKRRDLMSVFPAAVYDHQAVQARVFIVRTLFGSIFWWRSGIIQKDAGG
ncbi:hypothetical protein BYT27DRAFT_7264109 [Phlegmacium glaucopus]|nr:hypothetical protein BYT27DRAFT_7264109 [Phlegmacium glaucopus]